MPLDLAALVAEMRALGVTRIELELSKDAAPAPAAELMSAAEIQALIDPPGEVKGPGICIAPGCNADNGHRFAPEYCRTHALSAAGVD